MEIRKGGKRDFKEIAKLWLNFFKEDTSQVIRKYLDERFRKKEVLIAEERGKLIGFLTFSKNYFHHSDYAQFVMINRNHRRKGIATALMKHFEKQARKRKCRRIFSSAEPWNKIAIKMHRKLGYERCGYVDNIWGEGKRDLFFSKKLWHTLPL